ncbi:putative pentatricopeptide repeat-containing protein [Glycine max]|nr:putative pentatricopeptide repeat-containing protein [Glycine max]
MRYRRTHRIAVEGCLCLCRSWHSSSKWRRRNTVNSETLSRCPSDLIAFSLFLWSAQRRRHDSFAFDRIVTVLRRLTHRYDTVPAILSHLETIGCASLTNPVSQLVLLRIYSRAGMYAMLLEAYHHLQASYAFVPDTFARNLVMDALFRVGHSHLALTLTLSLFNHTHPPNFFTFHILLLHLSKLNNNNLNLNLPHIARMLRLMLWAGYSPSPLTFQMLLNSLCKINAFPQAYQLLALMTVLGINFSVNIWTILIHNYCKFGRLRLANNLFHNMLQTGCSPNVVTYTILFKAFMQSNMPSPAFRLFNVMLSSGQSPDLILCNVLIDCLSKAGRCQDAIQVFLSLSERNLKPDSYTFASLLSTICRSKMFYLLPKLVLVSRHVDADLVFCNALLSSLTKADLPSLAVGFYDHMIDEGFVPDKYTFAGLLSALCCAGRVDKAVNVYHGVVMSYHDIDAHIHTVIIVGLLKTGKFHKAVSVLRFAVMNKYPLDTVAYTVGICALLRGRRTQEACTLYDQMKNDGLKPSVHTYNMMLFTFCKERDLQMIKQILQEMIDSRIYLSGRNFSNLCKYMCRSDTHLSLLKLLAEIRDLRLLSAKALHFLNFDRHADGVQAKHKHQAEDNTEWNLILDTSSSEDLSDVAASMLQAIPLVLQSSLASVSFSGDTFAFWYVRLEGLVDGDADQCRQQSEEW